MPATIPAGAATRRERDPARRRGGRRRRRRLIASPTCSTQVRATAAGYCSRRRASPATGWRCGRRTRWHWVVAALGAHYAGATLVPLNTRYTGHEALDILRARRAPGLVVVGPFLDRTRWLADAATGRAARPAVVVRVPDRRRRAATSAGRARRTAAPISPTVDARAAAVGPTTSADILFTSGTTGRSKGVLSAHRQVARRRPGLGRVRRGRPAPTATWSSTRSSTTSATRPASWSAC